jgi:putative phosphoesterase
VNIAVLSDIHGNDIALEACLKYMEERYIDAYCFLGDYTGELPGIEKTMKMLYDLKSEHDCYFIRGNKENYQMDGLGLEHPEWDEFPSTVGMLRYAYEHLAREDIEFFNSLSITEKLSFPGLPDIVICHGSPRKVNEKLLPDSESLKEVTAETDADLIVCGHTHKVMDTMCGHVRVINPGSVGVSVDVPYSYRFLILHGQDGKWEPEFISLPADTERIVSSMREAGLYETAPYWTRFTELMVTGKNGSYTHAGFLGLAMNICREEQGECTWPRVPEECFEKAYKKICE